MELTDHHDALVERAITCDESALVELLEVLGPIVRARLIPKMGRHIRARLESDDIMQVTYLEICTRIDSFTGGGAKGFLAWLTRIAENNLIDAARAIEAAKRPDPRKRITGRADETSMIALVEAIGATYTTPSQAAARNEIAPEIDRALGKLPPLYARVIRLYDLQGLDAKAVGVEVNKSEGAIYMLRARAHDRLRDVLGSESRFFTIHGS